MVQHSPLQHPLEPARSLSEIFPPVRKSHILNCGFPSWHSLYVTITPKARIIPLTPEFLTYLREDGIILPDDEGPAPRVSSADSDDDRMDVSHTPGSDDDDPDDSSANQTQRFPELHAKIKSTIAALGGAVTPKLNWSAPKDALFMTPTHTLECRTASEIYLLLKSSDFITHDLEHAFDDCDPSDPTLASEIPYCLVLRKWFNLNPSMEFRAFVAGGRVAAICQRDLNHYEFLISTREELKDLIVDFHRNNLSDFPDPDFVFDVYITSENRVWLVDINPFAPRTESILFSWAELLRLRVGEDTDDVELRLVESGDAEAWGFGGSQYSASKLPKEVVEAGHQGEEAVWEFAKRWRDIIDKTDR